MTNLDKIDAVIPYRGHAITITKDHLFETKGGELENCQHHDSLAAAKKVIDGAMTVQAKADAKPLDLSVLGDDGKPLTIRRIHGGSGNLIFKEAPNMAASDFNVYPNTARVAEILAERDKLRLRLSALNAALHPLAIRSKRTWGRIENGEQYERMVEKLQKEHAAMLALARKGLEVKPAEPDDEIAL